MNSVMTGLMVDVTHAEGRKDFLPGLPTPEVDRNTYLHTILR
jgi:hypothetical protein|tara:strand:- start:165 stop:290 length:126 start_codon:yes stop_codon:yes gene_type:complete